MAVSEALRATRFGRLKYDTNWLDTGKVTDVLNLCTQFDRTLSITSNQERLLTSPSCVISSSPNIFSPGGLGGYDSDDQSKSVEVETKTNSKVSRSVQTYDGDSSISSASYKTTVATPSSELGTNSEGPESVSTTDDDKCDETLSGFDLAVLRYDSELEQLMKATADSRLKALRKTWNEYEKKLTSPPLSPRTPTPVLLSTEVIFETIPSHIEPQDEIITIADDQAEEINDEFEYRELNMPTNVIVDDSYGGNERSYVSVSPHSPEIVELTETPELLLAPTPAGAIPIDQEENVQNRQPSPDQSTELPSDQMTTRADDTFISTTERPGSPIGEASSVVFLDREQAPPNWPPPTAPIPAASPTTLPPPAISPANSPSSQQHGRAEMLGASTSQNVDDPTVARITLSRENIDRFQSASKLDDYKRLVAKYFRLKEEFENVQERLARGLASKTADRAAKGIRQELATFITTTINLLSTEKISKPLGQLGQLLNGDTITFQFKKISIGKHPEAEEFALDLIARTLVKQAENVASSHRETAYALAAASLGLWVKFPRFGDLLKAAVFSRCSYIIPYYPPELETDSGQDYLVRLGYLLDGHGVIETQQLFLKRMTGICRFWTAIMCAPAVPWNRYLDNQRMRSFVAHPLDFGVGWRFLVDMMQLQPQLDITATVLLEFLEMSSHFMKREYGRQFEKLLRFMTFKYLPEISATTTQQYGSATYGRLKAFLESGSNRFVLPEDYPRSWSRLDINN